MPELPEVETVKNGLIPLCVGRKILAVHVRRPQLRWPIPVDLAQHIDKQTISAIERRGKYLLIRFAHGTMLMHLGMSGICRVLPLEQPWEKHDHVIFVLDNQTSWRFNDTRRFGALLWTQTDPLTHLLLCDLGPEPLSSAFNADFVYTATRQRRTPIKSWLMNSHQVVGVGNIYACEALFAARIHPERLAHTIQFSEAELLVSAIKSILAAAIEAGGTTLRDFKNTAGKPGYFRHALSVYGSAGEPCQKCSTHIQVMRQAQRSTFFCPDCQAEN